MEKIRPPSELAFKYYNGMEFSILSLTYYLKEIEIVNSAYFIFLKLWYSLLTNYLNVDPLDHILEQKSVLRLQFTITNKYSRHLRFENRKKTLPLYNPILDNDFTKFDTSISLTYLDSGAI